MLKSNRKKCQWNSEQERTKDNFTKTFQKWNQIGKVKDKVDGFANWSLGAGQVMERGKMALKEDSKAQNHLLQEKIWRG